jgi:heme oxygenase
MEQEPMPGATTDLMGILKDAIRQRHARMERLPFIAALINGTLPLQCYISHLQAMEIVHTGCIQQLYRPGPPELKEFALIFLKRNSHTVALQSDLDALDHLILPDCLEALEHARSIVAELKETKHPEALLGLLYVLEGTTKGNKVHLPDVINCFGDEVSNATRYYAGYGEKNDHYWQEFCIAMNALHLGYLGQERLINAVFRGFDQLEELLSALYPVREDSWGFTARRLNPDAGHHPIPENAEEIQAAVIAARRCREEFPYFDERFPERSTQFTRSDTAWLVTLAALPKSLCLQQVRWLGRVLGSRGMPRITLERQLELLHEELVSAVPSRSGQYAGLREAAEVLRSERLACIHAESFRTLSRHFQHATHGELRGKLKNTGKLIISALCDEAGGITGAADSILSWLTDSKRFPNEWVSAEWR